MKKFFVYKCKLSLSLALLYSVDLFINKRKTKVYNVFYRMILNTERNHNSFRSNFSARAESFFCRQEKARAAVVWSLRAKIVIVGNSK